MKTVSLGPNRLTAIFSETSAPKGTILLPSVAEPCRTERTQPIVASLSNAGYSVVRVDLLTQPERTQIQSRFNIGLLTSRLAEVVEDLATPQPLGVFASGTGLAAALDLAVARPSLLFAIASRSGRVDLASEPLTRVGVPALLMVGSEDSRLLRLNSKAILELPPLSRLEVIPAANYLFEEPGALELTGSLATEFFHKCLPSGRLKLDFAMGDRSTQVDRNYFM